MRWARPRWYELLPEVLLAVGLLVFLIDEPDAATSAFRSGRAVALMIAAGVGWLIARVVVHRFVPWRVARTAFFGVAAIGALAVVVLPAYGGRTVIEVRPAAAATAVRTGTFTGIDHRADGTVSIYQASDGRFVVGLEAFDIQPGPNYDVYVVPGTRREDTDGGVRLDDLRGNRGTQFYDVPAEVDLGTGPWTVLIWCHTFGVPVAQSTPV